MKVSSKLCLQMVLLLSLAGHPLAATAQESNEDKARALFQSAMKTFALGHYDVTIEQLSAAYAFYPTPAFLYNLGLTWEKKGVKSKAAEFYGRYLDESGADDPELKARVESMEVEVSSAVATAAGRFPARGRESAALSRARAPIVFDEQDWPELAVSAGATQGHGPWPWVTVGTAGAGVVLGVVFASLSYDNGKKANDLSSLSATLAKTGQSLSVEQTDRYNSLKKTTRTQSIVADVSFGVAAAAGVVSLALFLTDPAYVGGDDGPPLEVGPMVGHLGEAGFLVTRRF